MDDLVSPSNDLYSWRLAWIALVAATSDATCKSMVGCGDRCSSVQHLEEPISCATLIKIEDTTIAGLDRRINLRRKRRSEANLRQFELVTSRNVLDLELMGRTLPIRGRRRGCFAFGVECKVKGLSVRWQTNLWFNTVLISYCKTVTKCIQSQSHVQRPSPPLCPLSK